MKRGGAVEAGVNHTFLPAWVEPSRIQAGSAAVRAVGSTVSMLLVGSTGFY